MYDDDKAFRAALEQRLKNLATGANEKVDPALLARWRKRVTFERFLLRLAKVAPDGWVLKGGFALELRLDNVARTTRDIDVDWQADEDQATELLLDAAAADLGDHFVFRIERVLEPEQADGQGQRWRLKAEVAGRAFETVLLDVGVETTSMLGAVELPLSSALDFAGFGPASVPSMPIEQHLAEKVHAYSRRYGKETDQPSSRVKDLVDLALIAVALPVEGAPCREAMDGIFSRRDTHPLPERLPTPPSAWTGPWKRLCEGLPVPADLEGGYSLASKLVNPVLATESFRGTWSPVDTRWGDS